MGRLAWSGLKTAGTQPTAAGGDGSAWTNGDCSLRVLRGGSFADKALAVRSSAWFRYDEDVRYYANGFRVARDLN